ncbi:ABC-2 type transport system ATP-binding protein [Caldalkalibacillus uzonensis]|uniref:ABC-2 type transport system ATP-binding protein n=1 Tax=Caldalkalibacillus uzonensis TaxID=353224 RepID=A0ABU0CV66_9BACI|nr:ABC transporter ATP-binding protein [Caldalkalibacillus uzonensis]MDQ0340316.1 ABC-2 type transport system ATP-binding protein [Caldalkalibacillus uzonensis]
MREGEKLTVNNQPCIVLNGVAKKYRSGRYVLRQIDLEVPQGCVCGIVGTAGAGKTTLVRLLAGLIRPTKGKVCIFDQNITPDNPAYRQLASFILNDSTFYSRLKVKELLQWMHRLYRHWDEKRCYSLIQGLDISLGKKIKQLPHEQKVWLSVIIALSARSKLIVLDGPTKRFSPAEKMDMLKLLSQDVINHGTTVVFTTHSEQELQEIADYGFRLEGGQLLPCELKRGFRNEAWV